MPAGAIFGALIFFTVALIVVATLWCYPLVKIARAPELRSRAARWTWLATTASLAPLSLAFIAPDGVAAALGLTWLAYLAFLWRVRSPAWRTTKRAALPATGVGAALLLVLIGLSLAHERGIARERHARRPIDWPLDAQGRRTVRLDAPPEAQLYDDMHPDRASASGPMLQVEWLWPAMTSRNDGNKAMFDDLVHRSVVTVSLYARPSDDALQHFFADTLDKTTTYRFWPSVAMRQPGAVGYDQMITPDHVDVKTPRYGLGHVGIDLDRYPTVLPPDRHDIRNEDLWFSPAEGDRHEVVIACTNDQALISAQVASVGVADACEQRFIYPPLNALVSVRYKSKLLPEWQEVRHGVERALADMARPPLQARPTAASGAT